MPRKIFLTWRVRPALSSPLSRWGVFFPGGFVSPTISLISSVTSKKSKSPRSTFMARLWSGNASSMRISGKNMASACRHVGKRTFELPAPDAMLNNHTVLLLAARKRISKNTTKLQGVRSQHRPVIIIGAGRVGRETAKALEEMGIPYRFIESDEKRPAWFLMQSLGMLPTKPSSKGPVSTSLPPS